MNEHAGIFDISPIISPRLAVFPGDTPLAREVLMDIRSGGSVTVSTLRATVHLGAHTDAPSHYAREGRCIEQQPLALYWGACEVIVCAPRKALKNGCVGREHLQVATGWRPKYSRVLLATNSYLNPEQWQNDFSALEPALVDWFADNGVRLVGVDTPSVDPAESKSLPAHQRFYACDMAIIEGLRLSDVPAGAYELCALPLALQGFDASPVRAALRRLAKV